MTVNFVDKIGRKPLIVACPIFCAINLTIYSVLVKYYGGPTGSNGQLSVCSLESKFAHAVLAAGKAAAVAMTFVYMTFYICIEVRFYPSLSKKWSI
jgi:hypothetical protein